EAGRTKEEIGFHLDTDRQLLCEKVATTGVFGGEDFHRAMSEHTPFFCVREKRDITFRAHNAWLDDSHVDRAFDVTFLHSDDDRRITIHRLRLVHEYEARIEAELPI